MLAFCLVPILAVTVRSQDAPQQGAIPLALVVPIERPLLVKQWAELRFDLPSAPNTSLNAIGTSGSHTVVHRLDYQWVDEQWQLSDACERSTRRYLRAYESRDGKVCDPPLTGLAAEFNRTGVDTSVHLGDQRILPDAELRQLLRSFHSIWLWVKLPSELGVGEECDLEIGHLLPVLFGPRVASDACSLRARFDAYDRETSIARLSGRAWIGVELDAGDLRGRLSADGIVRLTINAGEQRVVSVEFEGILELDRGSASAIRGSVKTTATATLLRHGQVPPSSDVRVRRIAWEPFDLAMDLPSSWVEVMTPGTALAVLCTLRNDLGQAVISLDRRGEGSSLPGALRQIQHDLKKEHPNARFAKVTSLLGEGLAVVTTGRDRDRQTSTRSEFYAFDDAWVVLQLSGDASACAATLFDFEAARATLRVTHAAKRCASPLAMCDRDVAASRERSTR